MVALMRENTVVLFNHSWQRATYHAPCPQNPTESAVPEWNPIDPGSKAVIRCRNKVAAQPWSPTEPKGRATEVKYEVQAAVRPSGGIPLHFHCERQRARCRRSRRHSVAMHTE